MFRCFGNAVKRTYNAVLGSAIKPNHILEESPPPLPQRSSKRKREEEDNEDNDPASPSIKRSRWLEQNGIHRTPKSTGDDCNQELPADGSENFPHYVLASNSVRTHHELASGMIAVHDTQGYRPALLMNQALVQSLQVSLEAVEYGFAERAKVNTRREVLAHFIEYAEAEYARYGDEFEELEAAGYDYEDARVIRVCNLAGDMVMRLRLAQEDDAAYKQHLAAVLRFVEVSKLQTHEILADVMYDSGLTLHEDIFYDTELPDDFVAQWKVPSRDDFSKQDEQSPKELARTDLHHRQQDLLNAQERFERRRELGRYDNTRGPETEIDVCLLQKGMKRTRALIVAEERCTLARAKAIELGVNIITTDQSSGFGTPSDDGEILSQAFRAVQGPAKQPHARRWLDSLILPVDASGAVEEVPEMDEWQVEEIGPEDSISMVATGRDRERIDTFEARYEQLRSTGFESLRSTMPSECKKMAIDIVKR